MIKLDPQMTFMAPISVNLVGFQAEFHVNLFLLPTDQVEVLQEQVKAGQKTGLDFAREVLAGWPDGAVGDTSGNALSATPDNVQQLLRMPGVPSAVINAFWRGYDEATEGNSAPLPAGS